MKMNFIVLGLFLLGTQVWAGPSPSKMVDQGDEKVAEVNVGDEGNDDDFVKVDLPSVKSELEKSLTSPSQCKDALHPTAETHDDDLKKYVNSFVKTVKENRSSNGAQFIPGGVWDAKRIHGLLNTLKNVLDENKNLTDLRVLINVSMGQDNSRTFDFNVHQGRLVGTNDENDYVQYRSVKDFPAEFRLHIQRILLQSGRNAQIQLKRNPQSHLEG